MYHIVIQQAAEKALAPKPSFLKKWAETALARKKESGEVTIRIVSVDEMAALNKKFRYKEGPTNVLSFPFDMPDVPLPIDVPIIGDIVICADIVNKEASDQGKTSDAHWAHMVVHGVFHLLGYDHQTDQEANVMESLEADILQQLGFANPYQSEN
jgi:probable rRNA maturation factor